MSGFNHDMFNLLALPIVIATYLSYLGLSWEREEALHHLAREALHHTYLYTFFGYIIIDFIWIILWPKCVASPKVILAHHIVVLLGLYGMFNIDIMNIGCHGTLIEVNTFFLILKRQYHVKAGNKCTPTPIKTGERGTPTPIKNIIDFLFYFTWITCRICPSLFVLYNFSITNHTMSTILIIILNALNLKWTFDLITKKNKSL